MSLHHHFLEQCHAPLGVVRTVRPWTWVQVHPDLPVRVYPTGDPAAREDRSSVEVVLDDIRGARNPAEIRWLLWEPPRRDTLRAALEAAGLAHRGDFPAMSGSLHGAGRPAMWDGVVRAAAREELDVRPVRSTAEAEEWVRIYTEANDYDRTTTSGFLETLPDAWRRRADSEWYLGYRSERAVTCAKLRLEPELDDGKRYAGIYQLATRHASRGRGYAGAVMVHLMARAAERGCTRALLQAELEAQRLYERLGFAVDSALVVYELKG